MALRTTEFLTISPFQQSKKPKNSICMNVLHNEGQPEKSNSRGDDDGNGGLTLQRSATVRRM